MNSTVSKFFNDFVKPSNIYTNYRVIPSIDGLKNTQRKCLYVLQSSTKEDKVSNKAAQISTTTSYLHGGASLEGVLTALNVRYAGSGQNLCVLSSNGQYGSKNTFQAGASRYVYTDKTPLFDKMYRKEDIPVYDEQFFEGDKIEPKTLLPVSIPLVNCQYSIGNGFASYLLPREPLSLLTYLRSKLENKIENKELLKPFIKGWYGTVTQTDINSYRFDGAFKKDNCNQLTITEIKPFCDLETYLTFLDKLVDNKVIKSYKDESTSTHFKFILNVPAVFFEQNNTDDKIRKALMLTENMNENLTMFDENDKIKVYENVEEYIEHFIKWRLTKYAERHAYYISKYEQDQNILTEKARFIKAVVEKELVLNNTPKEQILKWLKEHSFTLGEDLLKLPLYNITKEKYEELLALVEKKQKELDDYKKETPTSLWLKDLDELEVAIKEYNEEWSKEYEK